MPKVPKLNPRRLAVVVVAGLVVGILITTLTGGDSGTSLLEYSSGRGGKILAVAEGGFEARFPATPTRRTQSVKVGGVKVPVVDYTGTTEDHSFTVSYAEIPEGQEVGDPILRLNASATSAAEAVKGKLEASGITSFLGQPAVEYLISVTGRYVKATSFLAGRRIYGIEVVGTSDPPSGYDRFRSTFKLTG
ncbi:MAG: hypothetical protein ACRD0S_01970 [Acidimicrobiales bacterium]